MSVLSTDEIFNHYKMGMSPSDSNRDKFLNEGSDIQLEEIVRDRGSTIPKNELALFREEIEKRRHRSSIAAILTVQPPSWFAKSSLRLSLFLAIASSIYFIWNNGSTLSALIRHYLAVFGYTPNG